MRLDPKKKIEKERLEKEKKKQLEQIEKTKRKIEQQFIKNKQNALKKIQEMREKSIEDLKEKFRKREELKLKRLERQKERRILNHTRKIKGKETKDYSTDAKIKQRAFHQFQRVAKLTRMTKSKDIFVLDKRKYYDYKTKEIQIHAGHFFPKQRFPHMAFILNNCWPISAEMNKRQADNIGYERRDQLEKSIGKIGVESLIAISENKELKNKIRDRNYYQEQHDLYKVRADRLEKKLHIK